MTSRQGGSRSITTAGVRRNLFHHTLNRRAAAAAAAAAATTTTTTAPSTSSATASTAVQVAAEEHDGASDIVARDEHGNYQLDQPALAPLPRDELQEEREVGNRLIETYGKQRHQHIEPNELKASLQASLQAKVASLEEDKWMFEPDDPKPS